MGMLPSTHKLIEASSRKDGQPESRQVEVPAFKRSASGMPTDAAYFREAWIGSYVAEPGGLDYDGEPLPEKLEFEAPRTIGYPALPITGKAYHGIEFQLEGGKSHPQASEYVRDMEAWSRRLLPFARFIAAPVVKTTNSRGDLVQRQAVYVELRKTKGTPFPYPVSVPTILLSSALPREEAERAFWGVFWKVVHFEGGRIWNQWKPDGRADHWLEEAEMSLEQMQDLSCEDYTLKREQRMQKAFVAFATAMLSTGSVPAIPEDPREDTLWGIQPHTRIFVETFLGTTGRRILDLRNPGWDTEADDREFNIRFARKQAARKQTMAAAAAAGIK